MICSPLHQMAGVRLDHQPDFLAWREVKGVAGGERQVDFHVHPAVHAGGDDYVALLQRRDATVKDVSRAEPCGQGGRQQDVAGSDADAEN